MKKNILFEGIYSAIFSVYDENMNVKKETVRKMVEYQLANGLSGFYVCGNTGECTVLPKETRKQMLEAVEEYNAGRGKIICHVGAGHIDEVMELVEHANRRKIDAIASLPPALSSYYNAEEILDYYKILAGKSKYPVIAYVTPVLNCDIEWFAAEVMRIPNVVGIKLTISDYYEFCNVLKVNNGEINVLNGPDETMLCGLICGAQGAIGTTYNFLPRLACDIYSKVKAGDIIGARKCQLKLNEFISLALGKNLAFWKSFMTVMGFDMGYTVAPAKMPSAIEIAELKNKLTALGYFELIGSDEKVRKQEELIC